MSALLVGCCPATWPIPVDPDYPMRSGVAIQPKRESERFRVQSTRRAVSRDRARPLSATERLHAPCTKTILCVTEVFRSSSHIRACPRTSRPETGWLGSSEASPQAVTNWGLASLDPSHPPIRSSFVAGRCAESTHPPVSQTHYSNRTRLCTLQLHACGGWPGRVHS